MALFNDGNLSSIEDLLRHDQSLLRAAEIGSLDLGLKMKLAAATLQTELEVWLEDSGYSVEQVASTESLRQYHQFKSLELVYRDSYLSSGNERHGERWKAFQRQAKEAKQLVLQTGLGLVDNPIRRPEAPIIELVEGVGPSGSLQVAVTFVSLSGEEGSLSEFTTTDNAFGNAVTVRVPSGPGPLFHVYIGANGLTPRRQTQAALALEATWTTSSSVLEMGAVPSLGQRQGIIWKPINLLRRG